MPILHPDTSEALDFAASEPGTYRARAIKAEPVVAKPPKTTKGVEVTFEFEAPLLGTTTPRKTQRRSWMAIDGKGTFTFDQYLRVIGKDDLADELKAHPGQVGIDTDDLIGHEVNLVLTNQLYNDKPSDQISSFLPA